MLKAEDKLPKFKSKVNVHSQEYKANYESMKKLVDQLNERLTLSRGQGEEKYIAKHIKQGQLLARDRIELILDEDSPFLELMPLAGWGQKKASLGGSVVAGIGLVNGVECLITSSVPTIKGGSMNKVSVQKTARLNEIAFQNKIPTISLMQSGGADLTQQAKVFHMGGAAFRELARRSKERYTTLCVVFGSSTAGGAYNPGMSDYIVMVKNQAKVFLAGPPLVKMATSEDVDDETLGGADMHSRISGVSDYLAVDEIDAIRLAREIILDINYKKKTPLPIEYFSEIEEPAYEPDEILGISSENIRIPYDAREIIARIVDGSRFSEFKSLYGTTLICCFARIHGIPIGILANNGVLFTDSSNKGTQFIQLCNQRDIPLLFLQNITGFMVGKKYEQEGIIKAGARLINAVSNSKVPSITIMIGASYGAGNYAMAGRAYQSRFLFSWPNSKCSVMGEQQLAGVMDILFQSTMKQKGIEPNEFIMKMAEERKKKLLKLVEEQSNVYYTSSRMIDDGIIDPRDTRTVIGFCLSVIYCSEVEGGNCYGVSRM